MRRKSLAQSPTSRLLVRLPSLTVAFGLLVLAALSATLAMTTPAAAQEGSGSTEEIESCPTDLSTVPVADSRIRVVKVAGLIDPVVADYVLDELSRAEADDNTIGFVLRVNSRGSVLNDAEFVEFASRLRDSRLPIGLWVGQSGSTARGGAAELATVADRIAITPNSTIGATGTRRLPADWGEPFGDASTRLETSVFSADEAVQAGLAVGPLSDIVSIGAFAAQFDGFEVFVCRNADGTIATVPRSSVFLTGLPLTSQMFHTVGSPEVAYLFFTMGLAILVFELFVAGVGVAGVIGAVLLALGGYGLASLPTRWWAIALLLVSMFFLAIDIQTNVPRFYTIVGLVGFVVGTWFLYDGVTMSWITALAAIIGAVLYAYTGMPSMVRTRFSTPTIGRQWMIGELGEAVTGVDPEGTVKIREVTWRAFTNRATPVEKGGRVRVVGISRLLLEVEPEEGGARDYREKR